MKRFVTGGFSVVELVVALALVALVATAAARMLAGHQRSYRNQSERLAMAQNVRAALAILRFELRELGTDPTAGDIIDMTPHSISYEAARGVLHLCTPPELAARKVTLAARGHRIRRTGGGDCQRAIFGPNPRPIGYTGVFDVHPPRANRAEERPPLTHRIRTGARNPSRRRPTTPPPTTSHAAVRAHPASLTAGPPEFALGAVVLGMLFLAGLVSAVFWLAVQEQRMGRSSVASRQALDAADAGVERILDEWDAVQYGMIAPGLETSIGRVVLPSNSGWYRGSVRRLNRRLYLIRAEGFNSDSTARREVGLLAQIETLDLGVHAALTTVEATTLGTGRRERP